MSRSTFATPALLLLALGSFLACSDGGITGPRSAPEPGGETPTTESDGANAGEQRPDTLPSFRSLGLYSASSVFNTRISVNASADADSEAMVALMAKTDGLQLNVRRGTTTVFVSGWEVFKSTVDLPCAEAWGLGVSTLARVSIPDAARPSADPLPQDGCEEESRVGEGNHMVILDLDRRCEYDLRNVRRVNDRWVASWAAAVPMDSDGVLAGGYSTRASGFAFLGGVIWPDELARGRIEHRLVFSYPFTRSGGPVAPATDSDGLMADPAALPMGAIVQLDPELDVDTLGLDFHELGVARALQEYGMVLVDTSDEAEIGLWVVDPESVEGNPYEDTLPAGATVDLDNIPLEHLRVLELGEQDGGFREELALPQNGCSSYGS